MSRISRRPGDAGTVDIPEVAVVAEYALIERTPPTHTGQGHTPVRANPGDKLLDLIMPALAGGDCIDDANALRAGATGRILEFLINNVFVNRN